MPVNKSAMLRYRIIDGCLINSLRKFPTMEFILERIEEQIGVPISSSMFSKDLQQMKNMGAPIEYDRYSKGYFYSQVGYSMQEFPLTSDEIEALDFSTALLQQLKGTKMFEQFENAINKVIEGYRISKITGVSESHILQIEEPIKIGGSEWLELILKSIVNKEVLKVKYNAFGKDAKEHDFSPYLLKEYRNRWYAIGFSVTSNYVVTFALDRIKTITKSNAKYFTDPHFNPTDFFKYSIGIIQRHSKKPEKIILSFSTEQAPYILSQPLHQSQKTITENDNELQVELFVYITQELKMTILSYGKNVKVISPTVLKKEIKEIIQKMSILYK